MYLYLTMSKTNQQPSKNRSKIIIQIQGRATLTSKKIKHQVPRRSKQFMSTGRTRRVLIAKIMKTEEIVVSPVFK